MDLSAWTKLTFCFAFIAVANGRTLTFKSQKEGVDLTLKGINIYRGHFLFSVKSCKTATMALSTMRGTVRLNPDYKLVINEINSKTLGRRTVLYQYDKSQKVYQLVLALKQTESICKDSHWFHFRIQNNIFMLADFCNLKNIFDWNSRKKVTIRAALVSSENNGVWSFQTNSKVRCPSNDGKPTEDFLSLDSLVWKASSKSKTKTIKNSLFGFKSTGNIQLSYQTCQKAYLVLSSKAKKIFTLYLTRGNASTKTPSIVLLETENVKTNPMVPELKSADACKSRIYVRVYWSKDYIGAGFGCQPFLGVEWKIQTKEAFQKITINSFEKQDALNWKLAKDSCGVRYSKKTPRPPTIKPNKGSSSSSQSPPTANPFNLTPGSFSSSSKTSPIPIHTPLTLTTPMHQSRANKTGNNPKGSSETPPALLSTTDGGNGNEQKSKAIPIRLNISILYTSVIISIIVSPTKRQILVVDC